VAGPHSVALNPTGLGNGIYFLRITTPGQSRTHKIAVAH
jgi:hypothetical protein